MLARTPVITQFLFPQLYRWLLFYALETIFIFTFIFSWNDWQAYFDIQPYQTGRDYQRTDRNHFWSRCFGIERTIKYYYRDGEQQ